MSRISQLKVALLGAAGQLGQPLALMLKNSPLLGELALYDLRSTSSLCAELSHIDTRCSVYSFKGRIGEALQGADIVVIAACAPDVTNRDFIAQLQPNAAIVFELTAACAKYCPKAMIAVATNPVNSMLPVASEVMKRFRVYNPAMIFGITTLDVMRANMQVARIRGLPPEQVRVPVIGGHSDKTVVPVLSRTLPNAVFTNEELVRITDEVQAASQNFKVKADASKGNMSLSAAFAIARFVVSLAKAHRGACNIVECAYVRSDLYSNIKYLATPLKLGLCGVQKNLGIPPLSDFEECLLQNAAALLREDIKLGEAFVAGKGRRKSIKPPKPTEKKAKPDCLSNLDVCNPCT